MLTLKGLQTSIEYTIWRFAMHASVQRHEHVLSRSALLDPVQPDSGELRLAQAVLAQAIEDAAESPHEPGSLREWARSPEFSFWAETAGYDWDEVPKLRSHYLVAINQPKDLLKTAIDSELREVSVREIAKRSKVAPSTIRRRLESFRSALARETRRVA